MWTTDLRGVGGKAHILDSEESLRPTEQNTTRSAELEANSMTITDRGRRSEEVGGQTSTACLLAGSRATYAGA